MYAKYHKKSFGRNLKKDRQMDGRNVEYLNQILGFALLGQDRYQNNPNFMTINQDI